MSAVVDAPHERLTKLKALAVLASVAYATEDVLRVLVGTVAVAGLAAARARGRQGGRSTALADPRKLALARTLYDGGQTDVATICQTLGIARATLYRALKDRSGLPPLAPEAPNSH